jgi:hypothetical protein
MTLADDNPRFSPLRFAAAVGAVEADATRHGRPEN